LSGYIAGRSPHVIPPLAKLSRQRVANADAEAALCSRE
jgi:hypothetical protein